MVCVVVGIVEGGAVFASRRKYLVRVCTERFPIDFAPFLVFCDRLLLFFFGFPVVKHRLSSSAGVTSRSVEFKKEWSYLSCQYTKPVHFTYTLCFHPVLQDPREVALPSTAINPQEVTQRCFDAGRWWYRSSRSRFVECWQSAIYTSFQFISSSSQAFVSSFLVRCSRFRCQWLCRISFKSHLISNQM